MPAWGHQIEGAGKQRSRQLPSPHCLPSCCQSACCRKSSLSTQQVAVTMRTCGTDLDGVAGRGSGQLLLHVALLHVTGAALAVGGCTIDALGVVRVHAHLVVHVGLFGHVRGRAHHLQPSMLTLSACHTIVSLTPQPHAWQHHRGPSRSCQTCWGKSAGGHYSEHDCSLAETQQP